MKINSEKTRQNAKPDISTCVPSFNVVLMNFNSKERGRYQNIFFSRLKDSVLQIVKQTIDIET